VTGRERLERASAILREEPRLDREDSLHLLCQSLADLIGIALKRLDGATPAAAQETPQDPPAP
jgi:hypothetical protein